MSFSYVALHPSARLVNRFSRPLFLSMQCKDTTLFPIPRHLHPSVVRIPPFPVRTSSFESFLYRPSRHPFLYPILHPSPIFHYPSLKGKLRYFENTVSSFCYSHMLRVLITIAKHLWEKFLDSNTGVHHCMDTFICIAESSTGEETYYFVFASLEEGIWFEMHNSVNG